MEEQGGLRATFACGCMLCVLARPMADRQSRQTCARMDVLDKRICMGRGGRKERAGRHTPVQAMQHGSLMCREKKKEKRREADEKEGCGRRGQERF